MTGFGAGSASLGQGRVEVDLRALNHRFIDVRVRSPREIAGLAATVEQVARKRLLRGRIEAVVRLEGGTDTALQLDLERSAAAFEQLKQLRDRVCPDERVPLELLGAFPDLFHRAPVLDGEAIHDAVRSAAEDACQALFTMRKSEGDALRASLLAELDQLRELVARARESRPTVRERRNRLEERLNSVLDDRALLDMGRLEQEVALIAERGDVSEELARLGSHCEQFTELLDLAEPVGRRLDFLLQEMSRETNTLGAKSDDLTLTRLAVEQKASIERMREQVQNVV